MKYFLHTDTCVDFLKGQSDDLRQAVENTAPTDIVITDIVAAELLTAAWLSSRRAKNQEQAQKLISHFQTVPFDRSCTQVYADMYAKLSKKEHSLGDSDLLTAAIVLAQGGVLVTSRKDDFAVIKGLQLEKWS
ncbi:MAG: type II toxin-antitoxin system VapC family toxin [Coriobacteriales bacterium]|jgi:tRNA(fMet)-specific endonuclease VapC|nr:type II toxin-antitoxin system VapC family toxin [Coriobacteriales bacterium]